jgi:hypothetical protein
MQTFAIKPGSVTVQAEGKSGVSFNHSLLPNGVYTLSSDEKNVLLTLIGQLETTAPLAKVRDGYVDTGARRTPMAGEYYFLVASPSCVYRAVSEKTGGIPQTFALPGTSYGILDDVRLANAATPQKSS